MGICLIVKSGGGIDTSSATATADKILSGYTIYSNDNKVTGTMTSIGAQTESGKSVSSSTTIKAGWHDGTGKISASELKSQMAATTAAVGDVLTGYTYWTNGANSIYTGTMTSRGTKTWTIGVNGSQTIESGWHSGSGTVKQSSTVATNSTKTTMTPSTSQQTLCNASTYYSQERWCAGSSSLTAANIKKDITIFGVKGTLDSKYYVIKDGVLTSGLTWNNFWYAWDEDGPSQNNIAFTSNALNKNIDSYVLIDDKWYSDHYIIWFHGVIGNVISMSSYDANGKLSGVLCADFRLNCVNANPKLLMHMVRGTGSTTPTLVWTMSPVVSMSQTSTTNVTVTYRQTGRESTSLMNWFYGAAKSHKYASVGDFAITIDTSYWWSNRGQLYCKNLWFDVSATI